MSLFTGRDTRYHLFRVIINSLSAAIIFEHRPEERKSARLSVSRGRLFEGIASAKILSAD